MLVRFQSEATADIVMFGDIAKRLLALMGRGETIPSAMYADDIPQALDSLRRAISSMPENESQASGDDEKMISLAVRAVPLIELLEKSAEQQSHVMWEAE